MQWHRPRPWLVWISIALVLSGLIASGLSRTSHAFMPNGPASAMASEICRSAAAGTVRDGSIPAVSLPGETQHYVCDCCPDGLQPPVLPAHVPALAHASPEQDGLGPMHGTERPAHASRHARPDGRAPPFLA